MKGYYIILIVLCIGCTQKDVQVRTDLLTVPAGFPEIPFPEENAFTIERWVLGKKLFYDTLLSKDFSINCASCHRQDIAFADNKMVSPGFGGAFGNRNAPSLANVAYHPYYMREGGVPTLELQVLAPVSEHTEFNNNILHIAKSLSRDSTYVQMSLAAYGIEPNPFSITRALATFQRTLVSGNSRYDQYAFQGDSNALNGDELSGMALFFSDRTKCGTCHGGFNFTNYAFENNGIHHDYADPGRYRLTLDSNDMHKYKVPSLRNVGLTAPYMHDGSIATLDSVVAHYNYGGRRHAQQSELIRPIGLSEVEMNQLVQFLNVLTDSSFIQNPVFSK